MIYMTERWRITGVLAFLLLVAGLACVGSLRAQLKKEEVDFEVLATVTAQKGKDCCLWNMAAQYYGDPYEWPFLKEVNKIPNEKRISIGTVIYIPKKPLKKIKAAGSNVVNQMGVGGIVGCSQDGNGNCEFINIFEDIRQAFGL